jgi:hypothetical protein
VAKDAGCAESPEIEGIDGLILAGTCSRASLELVAGFPLAPVLASSCDAGGIERVVLAAVCRAASNARK